MIGHALGRAIWFAFKWWCVFCAVLYLAAYMQVLEDHRQYGQAGPAAPVVVEAPTSDD